MIENVTDIKTLNIGDFFTLSNEAPIILTELRPNEWVIQSEDDFSIIASMRTRSRWEVTDRQVLGRGEPC